MKEESVVWSRGMKEEPMVWTRDEAVELLTRLWDHLAPAGFHVALTGSVLTKGFSKKDLDVIVYPRQTFTSYELEANLLSNLLKSFGMIKIFDRDFIIARWREKGSEDTKWVEVYKHEGKRIDVFLLK
jgi:hypothetical protein